MNPNDPITKELISQIVNLTGQISELTSASNSKFEAISNVQGDLEKKIDLLQTTVSEIKEKSSADPQQNLNDLKEDISSQIETLNAKVEEQNIKLGDLSAIVDGLNNALPNGAFEDASDETIDPRDVDLGSIEGGD